MALILPQTNQITQVETCVNQQINVKQDRLACTSHEQYQKQMYQAIQARQHEETLLSWLVEFLALVLPVCELNLDPIVLDLRSFYAERKHGSQPYDPLAMMRSLLLMIALQEYRIKKWVRRLRREPILAILSGLSPERTPSIGAFYKFLSRLENGPYQPKCRHRVLPGEMRRARNKSRKPRRKPKPGEPKREAAPEGVIAQLVATLKARRSEPLPNDLETRLNELLLKVAVKPSAQLGILGDVKNLRVAGDGSVVPSYSNSWGEPTCDCRKQGKHECEHERIYSDPDADSGWDNAEKTFIWGYRYYQLVCGSGHHDLPLALNIGPANKHEAVMFLTLVELFQKQNKAKWPEAKIGEMALDAIHDATALCQYLYDDGIRYAIPFMNEPPKCQYQGEQAFDARGVPLCQGGIPMRRHGINKHGNISYTCPVKRPTHRDDHYIYLAHPEDCPLGALCEPDSLTGPTVSVVPRNDPRLHPLIARASQQFKELYDSRTTCERSNSVKKQTFLMKFARVRVMAYSYIRLTLISMLEHSRAWVADKYHLAGQMVTKEYILAFFGLAGT